MFIGLTLNFISLNYASEVNRHNIYCFEQAVTCSLTSQECRRLLVNNKCLSTNCNVLVTDKR